jgi:uncharacterized protein involved in outer membrane biogenesis
MNNFLLTLAAIFVFVLSALFAVPPFIDWNAYRGTFEEEVSRLLDREVRVQGRVSVSVLPVPFVSFEKVRIADQTGIAGSFIRAEQFKMWLSVPPLLSGIIEARQIELEKPVLRLRMQQDGTGNWQSLRIRESNLAFLPTDVALNSMVIDDGTVVFEHHTGEEITQISNLTGELSGVALRGPYKFIGTASAGDAPQEIRFSTAPLEADGNIRFRGTVRDEKSGLSHTFDGALNEPLGRSRIEGRLRTQSLQTVRSPDGGKASPFELTSKIHLDGDAFRLDDIAVTFQNKDRLQTLTGSALTSWQDGLVTRTRLNAPWLDLDAVAGIGPGENPLTGIERLLTRGLEPLGAGVTSASLDIQQGRLAGATVSGLKARMIRRDGITKVEELRVTLPGLTALALDGFVDAQKDGLQFDGNVVMRSANLNEFVQWLRPGSGAFAETVPGAVALNGALRVRPKKFDLSNASVDIAGERLDGSFAYDATPARPRLTADLETAAFDLSRLARDLLDPGVLAVKLGFTDVGAIPAAAGEAARLFDGMDLTLKVRARELTDGRRTFKHVHADLDRIGDRLTIRRLDLDWQPGVKLALSGELDGLGTAAAGKLKATIAAAGDTSATHLAGLLSRVLGENVPAAPLIARAPFRFAIDATLGGASTASPDQANYPTIIVADGTTPTGRLRLTARTAGALGGWREQTAHIDAHIAGAEPLDVAGWILGSTAEPGQKAAGSPAKRKGGSPKRPPATALISLIGKPMKAMKTVARFGAGEMLAADFSGTVSLMPGTALAARWSGDLKLAQADTRILSELLWPPLADRIAALPVSGHVALAGGSSDLVIEPQRLQMAESRLTGSLKLSPQRALSGKLAVSKVPLDVLSALLLARDGADSGNAEAGRGRNAPDDPAASLPWPRQRFDFTHLAGLSADLALTIGRLNDGAGATLARDIKTRFALTRDRVMLSSFEARMSEGSLKGQAELVKTLAGTDFSARLTGSGLPLTLLAPSLETGRRLTGQAGLTAELSGRALSPDALAGVLKGKGTLRLAKARVPGLTGEALTTLARKVVAGEVEPDDLAGQLEALTDGTAIELGAPTLDFTIANGIVNLPTMVVAGAVGDTRNTTVLSLRDLRFDSRWTVRPAPIPKPEVEAEMLNLPPVALIYAGTLGKLSEMKPELNVGDLEREIVVAKMEANVARLERLRREDEERAREEAERQRQREENERVARETERLRIERERAEGLRDDEAPKPGEGWESRVRPEPRPPVEDTNRPSRAPRPL